MQTQPAGYPQQGAPSVIHPSSSGTTTSYTYATEPGAQPVSQTTTVIIHTAGRPVGSVVYEKYPAKASKICGVLQLSLGILLIVLNVVALSIRTSFIQVFVQGILFIISGPFGIMAGRSRTRCPVVAFMVLSILGATSCIGVVAVGAMVASCEAREDFCGDDSEDSHNTSQAARVTIAALIAVCGGVLGVIAILSSTLCCVGGCCTTSSGAVVRQPPENQLQYISGQPIPGAYGMVAPPIDQAAGPMAGYTNMAGPPSYMAAPPPYSTVAEGKANECKSPTQ